MHDFQRLSTSTRELRETRSWMTLQFLPFKVWRVSFLLTMTMMSKKGLYMCAKPAPLVPCSPRSIQDHSNMAFSSRHSAFTRISRLIRLQALPNKTRGYTPPTHASICARSHSALHASGPTNLFRSARAPASQQGRHFHVYVNTHSKG